MRVAFMYLGFSQLMGQGILIHLLHEPVARFVGNLEAAADGEAGARILDGHAVP